MRISLIWSKVLAICTVYDNQCFHFSAFLFSLEISVHGFSISGKKSTSNFFFVKKFLSVEKKLICITIFGRQNGSWTHLPKKNKKNCRWKWRNSSAQGEQEKKKKENGVRTRLVPKEDKKGLNKPQTTIFSLIRSVVNESAAGRLGNYALVPGWVKFSYLVWVPVRSPCPFPASWQKLKAPS